MRLLRACPAAALGVGIFGFLLLVSCATADWHVPGADLRFTAQLTGRPSHDKAGYFLTLPDGGLLPSPAPVTTVVTQGGKALKSYTLWHNRIGGLGMVIEAPSRGDCVFVYVDSGPKLRIWTPQSGLYPSGIMCMKSRVAQMAVARTMGQFGAVAEGVHYAVYDAPSQAPISTPGGADLTGRPMPNTFYLLTHLMGEDPGRTWIATFINGGICEIRVNGNVLKPKTRVNKWGGEGAWQTIKKGFNRVEVLHALRKQPRKKSGKKKKGGMYLAIKPPHIKPKDLGVGLAGKDGKPNKAPVMEARLIRSSDVARSGQARIVGVKARDGGPVAVARVIPQEVYWLDHQRWPLIACKLSAITEGNPEDTTYTWTLGKQRTTLSGKSVRWLFAGRREHTVRLTAKQGQHQSRSRHHFYGYSTIETSLESASARQVFQDTSLTMFQAAEGNDTDPMASLAPEYWQVLPHTVSLGEGYPLLKHLFSKRWDLVTEKLPPGAFAVLRETVLDDAANENPKEALAWVKVLKRRTSNAQETMRLNLAEAEIRMFYFGQTNAALQLLRPLLRQRNDMAEMAKIRVGDLAFMAGNMNRATALYADVQNRVRHQRNTNTAEGRVGPQKAAPKKAEPERNARSLRLSLNPGISSRSTAAEIDNWKLSAMLGVSASETVKSLIDQGEWRQAKDMLQAWERQFPLAKLNSDYILQEARFYLKLDNAARVHGMLKAYCENMESTSYMPDTAWTLLACMAKMKLPREDIFAFAERMVERFEFHPAAQKFKDYVKFRK